jgi:hypothetical protein
MIYDLKDVTERLDLHSNSVTFFDLLSDENKELLIDLWENPKRKRKRFVWRPASRGFIPTGSTYPGKSIPGFSYYYTGGSPMKFFRDLIWTALFGSNRFKVCHWFVLWDQFEKTMDKCEQSQALLSILRLTTSKEGSSYNTKLKTVYTVASNALGSQELGLKYCQRLLKQMGLTLKKSDPKINEYFHWSLTSKYNRQEKPPKPNRIGVGYKDKGHLNTEVRPDLAVDSEDYFVPINDTFEVLLQRTDECRAMLGNYNPKRSTQILNALKQNLISN